VTLVRIFEKDIAREKKADPLLFRSSRRDRGDGSMLVALNSLCDGWMQ
jgi:hypothetical protein